MNKKSFFGGVVTGIVLTIVGLFVFAFCRSCSTDPIKYLEHPVSYENKTETSFEVFQVFGNGALAKEESSRYGDIVSFQGNTVLILGENFYSDQVVTVKNPMRVGTYSYTNNADIPMTVPVIDGEMK